MKKKIMTKKTRMVMIMISDDEFLPEDNNDVRNHQKGKRSAVKDSKRAAYNSKYQNQIWMEMFEKLVAYKKLHKNTLVPRQYNEDPKFGRWVQTQRQNCQNDDIIPNRLALLNSIYFSWKGVKATRQQMAWMKMYQKIVDYKKLHKNTFVPTHYEENLKLGRWVSRQRQNYKNDDILPNRLALLNSIYFRWEGGKAAREQMAWMNMYQKIVAYKKMHKNTIVPFHYQEDPKLGHWVSQQRLRYKNDSILPKRVDLLKSIGFEWDGAKVNYDELWMGMYQKLVAYKDMHKNCMVPSRYQEDPKLGRWVFKQRRKYKNEELLSKRVDLLKSIDFEWIDSVKRKKTPG